MLAEQWPELEAGLAAPDVEDFGSPERDMFLTAWNALDTGGGYLKAIHTLSPELRAAGTRWLKSVVYAYARLWSPA